MEKITNVVYKTAYEQLIDSIQHPANGILTTTAQETTFTPFVREFCTDNGTRVFPLEAARVADVLDERRVTEMLETYPRVPVFIENRPGKGKNYFVMKQLLPEILKREGRLLIMNPRTLLKNQTKQDIMKELHMDFELYTDKRIDLTHTFENVDVFSYQEIEQFATSANSAMRTKYMAVVFDEVQFFTQDADFNAATSLIFNYLMSRLLEDDILRIYMTATPDRIFDLIEDIEKHRQKVLNNNYFLHNPPMPTMPTMNFYRFATDYSYINPIFFDDDDNHENIVHLISSAEESRWLIFVEDSSLGEYLCHILSKNRKTLFINSKILHSDKTPELKSMLHTLVAESEMPVDVLIITKCLDVGVNIHTKNVNIICLLRDKIDFLQAIGRKRVTEGANSTEIVNLFIPDREEKMITTYRGSVQRLYNEMYASINSASLNCPFSGGQIEFPFFVKEGKLSYNSFTLVKLNHMIREYDSLLDKIAKSPEDSRFVIRQHILSWMPGARDSASITHGDNPGQEIRDKIIPIITKYITSQFDHDAFLQLIQELKDAGVQDPRSDKRESRSFSTQTINRILEIYDLPYKLACNKGTFEFIRATSKEE